MLNELPRSGGTATVTAQDGTPIALHHLGGTAFLKLLIIGANGFHPRCYEALVS